MKLLLDTLCGLPQPVWATSLESNSKTAVGRFEVTLGTGLVDQGAASLRKFNSLIDTDTCGAPTVLGVISGNGYGYVRPDGVAVIPVGALAA